MNRGLAFDIAREMARQVDREIARQKAAEAAGIEIESDQDAMDAELRGTFPTATRDDFKRARLILRERVEMLLEPAEGQSWWEGFKAAPYPSAETLFPKPDKAKS